MAFNVAQCLLVSVVAVSSAVSTDLISIGTDSGFVPSSALSIAPAGIASAEAFGAATVSGAGGTGVGTNAIGEFAIGAFPIG